VETYNVEENWANIKEAILETAKESIGYKPTKTWIRTWNEELKQIMDKKSMNIKYICRPKTHNNISNTRNLEQMLGK
jgi:uncharacterized protein (DUF1697 family)